MLREDYPEIYYMDDNQSAKIAVIGVGGGGTNALNYMIKKGIDNVITIAANTDIQHLENSYAEYKLTLGKSVSKGRGAGSNPEVGRRSAEESVDEIRQLIRDVDVVIISAGMGGGTGTGASPVIARVAREMEKLVIAVVTKPFSSEGQNKLKKAQVGIRELAQNVDSIIVIANDEIIKKKELKFHQALSLADEVLYKTVKAIVDIIIKPSYINVDLEDVRTVLKNGGYAIVSEGVGRGERRAEEALKKALENPLIDNVKSIQGAKGILVNIHSSPESSEYSIRTDEVSQILTGINNAASRGRSDVEIILGLTFDDSLNDEIRIILIAAGMETLVKSNYQNQRSDLNIIRYRPTSSIYIEDVEEA
ncbi:MAG: cell division protein FtsZ [candidate division WOR-3 bacterium]|nr:cell division protein FtsZ [candidate division WOR-3 bacterium]MCX7948044.1 cell division protein FtsZ [candidate division WOR-3 bacterium]MDW8151018.1 cell division protein FtsZ [candidate division WOR-3 bacterium]